MKVIIGSDHAGFALKEQVLKYLNDLEIECEDKGTNSDKAVDYPIYAHAVAEGVKENKKSFGILICGSANGVCMTANKHKEIRAAVAWNPEIADLARMHNDANIICIPARYVSKSKALAIVSVFLETAFEGGRHKKRVDLI